MNILIGCRMNMLNMIINHIGTQDN